jgi:hypothetical protein
VVISLSRVGSNGSMAVQKREKGSARLDTTSGWTGVLCWDSGGSSVTVARFRRPEAKGRSIYVTRAVTNSRVAKEGSDVVNSPAKALRG